MSAMASYTPGMEISGGSLGHGLPLSIGFCLALKRKKSKSFVYCLFSDGELDEGSVWEAAMSAGHWKLDNLIAIVDVNNMQADGPRPRCSASGPLVPKFEAFGWHVQRVAGNDIDALVWPSMRRAAWASRGRASSSATPRWPRGPVPRDPRDDAFPAGRAGRVGEGPGCARRRRPA